ncbi:hypothetical protein GCM10022248_03890 [Nonomuraea soli]
MARTAAIRSPSVSNGKQTWSPSRGLSAEPVVRAPSTRASVSRLSVIANARAVSDVRVYRQGGNIGIAWE